MVFFNMIPSLAPAEKHKPKHRAKTLKNRTEQHTRKTTKMHRGRKIKLVPKKMHGGFADGCDTTGLLVTEPGLNIGSVMKGIESGLNINKTVAKIESSNSKK